MVKEIELTQGKVAMVDAEDYDKVSQYSWRNHNGYAARTTSRREPKRTTILMHREILGDIPQGMDVDHINGNKGDNRKSNLRIVTREQNMHNASAHSEAKSPYRGVSKDERRDNWRLRMRVHGKDRWVGYFDSEDDAARMYNFWAADLFGEYARLNEIDGMKPVIVAQG